MTSFDKRHRQVTGNQKGFAHTRPIPFLHWFYEHSALFKGFYADIGCAYGFDTYRLLEGGGAVMAIDPHLDHLEICEKRGVLVNKGKENLLSVCASLPHEDSFTQLLEKAGPFLPQHSPWCQRGIHSPEIFEGVLLSRVLPFMTLKDIQKSLIQIFQSLKPKGSLYVVTLSPFSRGWESILPAFWDHYDRTPLIPFCLEGVGSKVPQMKPYLPDEVMLCNEGMLANLLEQSGFSVDLLGRHCHDGTTDVYARAKKPVSSFPNC